MKDKQILTTNCCRFVEHSTSALESLQILHFVRETKQFTLKSWKTVAYYQLCFVLSGTAKLKVANKTFTLQKGTLFLLFSAVPYIIDAETNFVYTYIAFIGKRANQLFDKYGLTPCNCVFHGFQNLEKLWTDAIEMDNKTLELSAEGVLLFSIATFGENFYETKQQEKEQEKSIVKKIKDYIDIHFANQGLSLQTISDDLLYSPKYISTIFKRCYKISFKSYLNMVRIQNACALIEKENYCIKEIAFLCGFNDPLYFSKIFKQRMGITLTEQIEDCKGRKSRF